VLLIYGLLTAGPKQSQHERCTGAETPSSCRSWQEAAGRVVRRAASRGMANAKPASEGALNALPPEIMGPILELAGLNLHVDTNTARFDGAFRANRQLHEVYNSLGEEALLRCRAEAVMDAVRKGSWNAVASLLERRSLAHALPEDIVLKCYQATDCSDFHARLLGMLGAGDDFAAIRDLLPSTCYDDVVHGAIRIVSDVRFTEEPSEFLQRLGVASSAVHVLSVLFLEDHVDIFTVFSAALMIVLTHNDDDVWWAYGEEGKDFIALCMDMLELIYVGRPAPELRKILNCLSDIIDGAPSVYTVDVIIFKVCGLLSVVEPSSTIKKSFIFETLQRVEEEGPDFAEDVRDVMDAWGKV